MLAVIFRRRYLGNSHARSRVQKWGCPLWVQTQISWGTMTKLRCPICSQKALGFRNACFYCTSHSFAKNHSSPAAYSLLNFKHFIKPSQAKSVYLGSGGGKNATTIALRWIIELRQHWTGSHVREAPRHATARFSLYGLSALCEHCIKHSQTGVLHRYTFER